VNRGARFLLRAAVLLLASGVSAQGANLGPFDAAGRISVWVDLDLPALASVAAAKRGEREALRLRIGAQQDAVMDRLRALDAQEQARVQLVRNAIAVRLLPAQIEAARQIPGVRAVRVVRHQSTNSN
jgi:hypothetical protein